MRTLGRLRLRWEDNIKMDLKNTEWEDIDWIYLAQNRDDYWAFMNVVMNSGESAGNFLTSQGTLVSEEGFHCMILVRTHIELAGKCFHYA